MAPAPVDFLDALAAKEAAAEINIGGRLISVPRARLGAHYRLQAILSSGRPMADIAGDYVAAATGLSLDEIDAGSPAELMGAFGTLVNLNRFRGMLAVLWPHDSAGKDGPRPEDYPHRALASVVALLARAYGWPADHILEGLGPEEAMCYVQEARVLEHEGQEFQWRMAGGGVDKDGKPKQFPPIPWGRPPEAPRRRRMPQVPARFQPIGVIISPEEVGVRGRT
jgi:hypothetical protein